MESDRVGLRDAPETVRNTEVQSSPTIRGGSTSTIEGSGNGQGSSDMEMN